MVFMLISLMILATLSALVVCRFNYILTSKPYAFIILLLLFYLNFLCKSEHNNDNRHLLLFFLRHRMLFQSIDS